MQNTFPTAGPGGRRAGCLKGLILLLVTIAAAGCSDRKSPNTALQGKVVIRGSDTFGQDLGPSLIAAFQTEFPNVTIDLDAKGSEPGLQALLAGQCDIAAASRPVSREELQAARSRGTDLEDNVIGFYGVAVIVSTNNPVGNLTPEQVRNIFTGSIESWKALGGPDRPIHVYIRDALSGAYVGFRQLAMENKPYTPAAKSSANYSEMAQAVAQDAGAIGYSSVPLAKETSVKALTIRGMVPNPLAVNEGDYPYTRALRLYTRKAAQSPAAKEFIRFVESSTGQQLVRKAGFAGRMDPRMQNSLGD